MNKRAALQRDSAALSVSGHAASFRFLGVVTGKCQPLCTLPEPNMQSPFKAPEARMPGCCHARQRAWPASLSCQHSAVEASLNCQTSTCMACPSAVMHHMTPLHCGGNSVLHSFGGQQVYSACSLALAAALRPRIHILTQPCSPERLPCTEPACWSCPPG